MSASVQDTWRSLGIHMANIPLTMSGYPFCPALITSSTQIHLFGIMRPSTTQARRRLSSQCIWAISSAKTDLRAHIASPTSSSSPRLALCTSTVHLTRHRRPHHFSHFSSPSVRLALLPPLAPKSHKFHLEGRKDGAGSIKTGSLRIGRHSQHAWSFCSRSHDDMIEWWNDIRMLCVRYLVASAAPEWSGPVAAGYLSEEEEDEEEEGSSVEEERHGGG